MASSTKPTNVWVLIRVDHKTEDDEYGKVEVISVHPNGQSANAAAKAHVSAQVKGIEEAAIEDDDGQCNTKFVVNEKERHHFTITWEQAPIDGFTITVSKPPVSKAKKAAAAKPAAKPAAKGGKEGKGGKAAAKKVDKAEEEDDDEEDNEEDEEDEEGENESSEPPKSKAKGKAKAAAKPTKAAAASATGESSTTLDGLLIVVSGVIEGMSRNEAHSFIENHGGKIGKSITGKTNLVVLGGNAGPKKIEKIQKDGIKTMEWDEFVTMCESGGGASSKREAGDDETEDAKPLPKRSKK